jgi:hypothetical protein
MATGDESLATGNNLVPPLSTAWTTYIQNGLIFGKQDFADDEKFDILRGWPFGGALGPNAYTVAAPSPTTPIRRGMFVSFDTNGNLELATGGTTPQAIMMAIGSETDKDVIATNYRLPVILSNAVFQLDLFFDAPTTTAANFAPGASVSCTDGLLDFDITSKQIVGRVLSIDTTRDVVVVEFL